ncbi:MAG: eukaryotic-like serine/threonine-protein kinase [Frankiales bacterium]|jgi:pSer/pThr/pTyr-binding forkhead associated (FHA) protein|nr:eukaryotic-like serine/threonine-protein kinase [Frankiales bacterium]
MFMPGDRIGRFTVEGTVSAGAQADTVVVRDADDSPALMTLLTPAVSEDVVVRDHFWAAVRRLRNLSHPNVLTFREAGLDQGRLWIVTNHAGGQLLSELLGAGSPLAATRTLPLMSAVADALDAAHERGLLHLDLGPTHVWVSQPKDTEWAYLTGFATSRMRAAAHQLTATGRLPTTLSYTAPEQFGHEEVGPAADQYSLACLLVECLTGRAPFVREHALALIDAHLQQAPPPLRDIAPHLPRALDDVVQRGLAKRPTDRFADCRTLMGAARAAFAARSGPAGPTNEVVRRRALVVIGGMSSGLRLPLDIGDHLLGRGGTSGLVVPDPFLSRQHLRLHVREDAITAEDAGSSNGTIVAGQQLRAPRQLGSRDVVEAGASLFRVDLPTPNDLESAAPPAAGADAATLVDAVTRRRPEAWRPIDSADAIRLRLGFKSTEASAGPPFAAVTVDLARVGSLAVRANPDLAGPIARWVLVQCATLYGPTELTLAAALHPSLEDLWSWVALLPQAHVDARPLSGQHVVTDVRSAGGLIERLHQVVADRQSQTREVVDGVIAPMLPRLLVVADGRLISADDIDALVTNGPLVQVYTVWFGTPKATLPSSITATADVDDRTGSVELRVAGSTCVTGTADGVSASLAREVAKALSRSDSVGHAN